MGQLKEDIKEKWCAALESGEYTQCKGRLKGTYEDSYCCLGVLCAELCVLNGAGSCIDVDADGTVVYNDNWVSGYLTDSVMAYVGIDSQQCSVLVDMNDFHRKPFKEIAAYIRENL